MTFCAGIVPEVDPIFLNVEPLPGAALLDCFAVVRGKIQADGGTMCLGWQIWEWPGVMLEAEFHGVWRDAAGELHDLTPKQHGFGRVLFLPDREAVYEEAQVASRREAQSERKEVGDLLAALDAEFEFMNRGDRAHQHGQIRLTGAESREWEGICLRKIAALAACESLVSGAPRAAAGSSSRDEQRRQRNRRKKMRQKRRG